MWRVGRRVERVGAAQQRRHDEIIRAPQRHSEPGADGQLGELLPEGREALLRPDDLLQQLWLGAR
eukprot:6930758-Prymnesium_polylepis.1